MSIFTLFSLRSLFQAPPFEITLTRHGLGKNELPEDQSKWYNTFIFLLTKGLKRLLTLHCQRLVDRKRRFSYALLLYITIMITALLTAPVPIWADDPISAITMPVGDVTLSLVQAGKVAKIHVREGELVQPGQLLIQLDDAAEQTQLLMLKEQSEDMTEIEGRKALLDQKKVYLDRLQWAAERGSATEMEVP